MNNVEGKIALVSGGARGLGGASAIKLAQGGARVVITDVREDEALATLDRIQSAGGEGKFIRHDVAVEDQWVDAIQFALDEFGGLDILINNAGVAGAAKPLEELSLESWRRLNSVNYDGVFLGIKHAIRPLRARAHMWPGGGSIVNTSSVMGFVGGARAAAYCASKGGVRLLTKAAALELAPARIRVNSVHPGFINTPLFRGGVDVAEQRKEGGGQHFIDGVVARHPIGRLGEEVDIANAVCFLASDDSAFMTGTEVVVDGGCLAQ